MYVRRIKRPIYTDNTHTIFRTIFLTEEHIEDERAARMTGSMCILYIYFYTYIKVIMVHQM
jgi:hypothetical protein